MAQEISVETLLANGYRAHECKCYSSADTLYQKGIRDNNGVLLYSINAFRYDFRKYQVSINPIRFTIEIAFYEEDTTQWYTLHMNDVEHLTVAEIEEKAAGFFKRNGFIPDPYND